MIRIALLGAGSHSRQNHLPALARYAAERPGEVELVAVCDLDRERAEEAAQTYGFGRAYTALADMLRAERPDGCIAVTPISETVSVAAQVIRAGVPLLMEKPPGADVEQARQLVDLVESADARVMVSVNRRFDPALRAGLAWWKDRPLTYLHARIVRINRREPEFMYGTGIHPLDAMREIAGDVCGSEVTVRRVDGVPWYIVRLEFSGGTSGLLEVLPSAGSMGEAYELFGDRARARIGAGDADSGMVHCWLDGEQVVAQEPAAGQPPFVRNGAYDETAAFIAAIRESGAMYPSPAIVLQSVELCAQIQKASD